MSCDSKGKLNEISTECIPAGWKLVQIEGIDHLRKEYSFKNFIKAMHFSNEVAELAELHNHHPMIISEWGKVTLHWWTHTANGITPLDLNLAQLCDELNG
jgi:4a-hydroxytetrahydrobiopterin dehydratase